MAITSRVSLKSQLEDGDTLEGDVLADLIDSYLHLSDTSAQTVISPVTFTGSATFENINMADLDVSSLNAANVSTGSLEVSAARITTSLSAQAVTIEGILSAASISVDKLEVSGSANFKDLQVSGINAALIECGRIQVSGVSAFSVWSNRAEIVSAVIVSADFTQMAEFQDSFILNGSRFEVSAAIPAAGSDNVGDIVFNSTPVAGGTVGWVNVSAGTPGKWKEFGNIEV